MEILKEYTQWRFRLFNHVSVISGSADVSTSSGVRHILQANRHVTSPTVWGFHFWFAVYSLVFFFWENFAPLTTNTLCSSFPLHPQIDVNTPPTWDINFVYYFCRGFFSHYITVELNTCVLSLSPLIMNIFKFLLILIDSKQLPQWQRMG